jgi:hypothetical protein
LRRLAQSELNFPNLLLNEEITMANGPESNTEERLAAAKPNLSLLHHLAALNPPHGFRVRLLDGESYEAAKVDHVFTDGISIINEDTRIYIPLDAISSIRITKPPVPL